MEFHCKQLHADRLRSTRFDSKPTFRSRNYSNAAICIRGLEFPSRAERMGPQSHYPFYLSLPSSLPLSLSFGTLIEDGLDAMRSAFYDDGRPLFCLPVFSFQVQQLQISVLGSFYRPHGGWLGKSIPPCWLRRKIRIGGAARRDQ